MHVSLYQLGLHGTVTLKCNHLLNVNYKIATAVDYSVSTMEELMVWNSGHKLAMLTMLIAMRLPF